MLSVARISNKLCPALHFKYGASMTHRMLSMHKITESLYLCTDKPRNIEVDKKSLRFNQVKENTKPIVLMISWFYGKPSQINKYSKLYTDQGFDVLVGQISLTQFIFSIKGVEAFAKSIADALNSNEHHYNEIFIHTFSAGGGMWGIVQRIIKKDLDKYGNVPKRVLGQVWDSVAHPDMTIVALPFAFFPKNIVLQSLMRAALWCHLTLYRPLQPHYTNAVNNFYDNLARTPALVFASKVDPIGTESFASEVVKRWRANGVNVTYKCFEDSPHVKHFQTYPDEYLKYLHNHWNLVKLLERK